MEIVLYPDPLLRKKNAPVETFDAALEQTARDMFEIMYRTQGVGLAAPQVGINVRLLVYNPEGSAEKPETEVVLCNPRVVKKGREKEFGEEGCLSFPGIYAQVERITYVVMEAEDLQGETFQLELRGWDARIFLHEFDHLEGVLFVDRMTPSDRVRLEPKLDDLKASFAEKRASA